ncbi:MAG: cytochrome c maturation protein CcmE [Rickettsiales bacterium]|nr:cytochrome c maturation protein CcmE [Rickettsiales bacterium]
MSPKKQRMWLLMSSLLITGLSIALIMYSFKQHMVYFFTPTQLKTAEIGKDKIIRIGGLVEVGSIEMKGPKEVMFVITDLTNSVPVRYKGYLPNLFRDGQGVVAQGKITSLGMLDAQVVLAKHDERYMPPSVVDALKASGRWQHYSDENVKRYKQDDAAEDVPAEIPVDAPTEVSP